MEVPLDSRPLQTQLQLSCFAPLHVLVFRMHAI